MFYLAGVGLAFFLSVLLLAKRNKTIADKILTAWLIFMTLHLLLFYFKISNTYQEFLGLDIPLPLIHGPFLYLYTRALTNRILPLKFSILHFVTPACVFAYVVPFLFRPLDHRIYVYEHHGEGYETFNLITNILIMASGPVYFLLSTLVLRQHRRSIVDEFSAMEKVSLRWLQYLIYGIGAIWALVLLDAHEWIFVGVVMFIAFIGFFGIRQTGIFISLSTASEEESGERKKYQKSGLTPEQSEALHRNLAAIMESENLFRQPELSLTDLATKLNTPPNHLSQVINERENKNFYDYINGLRIEAFKQLASSPESRKYTLLGLAQECGFSSKSSFNRYFRKATGQSPSEFMQSEPGSSN